MSDEPKSERELELERIHEEQERIIAQLTEQITKRGAAPKYDPALDIWELKGNLILL